LGFFEVFFKAALVFVGSVMLSVHAFSYDIISKPKVSVVEPQFGKASPPVGYVQFCATGEDECKTANGRAESFGMSAEKWDLLNQVNTYVNGKIKPASDIDLYNVAEKWAYPTDAGDCEDYVLLKKRYLQSAGFNADELLITVVLDEHGEGHAVLTVASDEGDFILDNRRNEILRWNQAHYKFLKRQSQQNPRQWVSLAQKSTQVLVGTK
jgi:predicted transglutaminase-like cysteine proteinase